MMQIRTTLCFGKKRDVPGYLTDYTDGLKFRNSDFFNRKTINLMVYQDASEVVVNALGNATSRHKLLCVYVVIGNLDPHLCALTDNVYLVLLCMNRDFSYFGVKTVFPRFVEDIKILEEEDIVVHASGEEETVYGSIFTSINHNLGAS